MNAKALHGGSIPRPVTRVEALRVHQSGRFRCMNEHVLAYEATKLGFEVSDNDVRASIQQMIPSLFPDGKFAGKDAYASVLAEQQLTISEFETNLRRQILITKLREVAVEGTIVSPLEIEHAYQERNEKIKIQYVKVTGDKYRSEEHTSELQSLRHLVCRL